MIVTIDAERCQGHNRCYQIAPELVDIDEMGNATIKGDGTVAEELQAKARLAVSNCPEYAITLTED